jgi:hypothetical protein
MTQAELNCAVARATGETIDEISQRGFVLLTRGPFDRDPESYTVDWDEYDLRRNVALID